MTEGAAAQESAAQMADGTNAADAALAGRGDPVAVVVIVHGLGEHGGRYDNVARGAHGRRMEVHAYDHRGYGGSGGRRDHVERCAHAPRRPRGAAAASGRRAPACRSCSTATRFGGLVATGYLLAERRGRCPTSLVLSAPALLADGPRLEALRGDGPWPRAAAPRDRQRASAGGLSPRPRGRATARRRSVGA